jgi:hypothetical protein
MSMRCQLRHLDVTPLPQQRDAVSCGLFMLAYAEIFIARAPPVEDLDALKVHEMMDFTPDNAELLRLHIWQKLVDVMRDQVPPHILEAETELLQRRESRSAARYAQPWTAAAAASTPAADAAAEAAPSQRPSRAQSGCVVADDWCPREALAWLKSLARQPLNHQHEHEQLQLRHETYSKVLMDLRDPPGTEFSIALSFAVVKRSV